MLTDKKSDNVNILRWAAAIMVMVSHAPTLVDGSGDLCYLYTNGQSSFGGVAVAVFFFLSGLYVTKSLQKCGSEKEYLWKRCKRIFPSLWLVVVACVFIVGPVVTTRSLIQYFTDEQTYLYLLNGILLPVHELPGVFEENFNTAVNGSLWTLPVEFLAYIVLMLVWTIAKRWLKREHAQIIFHLFGVIVLFGGMMAAFLFVSDSEFWVSVIRPVVIFFVGALYFDFEDKIPLKPWLGLLCGILLILLGKTPFFSAGMILFIPYIIASMVIGTRQISLKTSFFRTSYEMYLVGFPIQQLVMQAFHYQMTAWQNCLISIPIDLLSAYGIYTLIEKRKKK